MIEILAMKYKDKKQKAIEKELGWMFIRINSDEENVNIFKAINENTDTLKNQLENL